jgi:hypothetical protein
MWFERMKVALGLGRPGAAAGVRSKKPAVLPHHTKRGAVRRPAGVFARISAGADRWAFDWTVRERLYRHIAAQHTNGVKVQEALKSFARRMDRRKKTSSAAIVRSAERLMRDGSSLGNALRTWVPQDEAAVITSAELSGLSAGLETLVKSKQQVRRVKKAYKESMVKPTIYAIAIYMLIWVVGKYVTPSLEQMVPPSKATGLVAALFVGGDFAMSWMVVTPVVFAFLVALIVAWSFANWTGRLRLKAEAYFPYSFYRDTQGFIWLMTYAALHQAGQPDAEILRLQMVSASPWLRERLKHVRHWLVDGKSFPAALSIPAKRMGAAFEFPNPDVVDEIESLAGFRDFSARITTLALAWSTELEEGALKRAARFGGFMEVFMYVVISFVIVAMMQLGNQVGAAGKPL